jgi:hypothetical protein
MNLVRKDSTTTERSGEITVGTQGFYDTGSSSTILVGNQSSSVTFSSRMTRIGSVVTCTITPSGTITSNGVGNLTFVLPLAGASPTENTAVIIGGVLATGGFTNILGVVTTGSILVLGKDSVGNNWSNGNTLSFIYPSFSFTYVIR